MLNCSQSDALTSWEKVTNFVVFIAMFHKPMATTTHNPPQLHVKSCEIPCAHILSQTKLIYYEIFIDKIITGVTF